MLICWFTTSASWFCSAVLMWLLQALYQRTGKKRVVSALLTSAEHNNYVNEEHDGDSDDQGLDESPSSRIDLACIVRIKIMHGSELQSMSCTASHRFSK